MRPGEVHVLLGENGAGKSTLMKILCGQYPPDAGRMALDGAPLRARARRLRRPARGVAMIHQELSIIPPLTVAENILLGDEPARAGRHRPAGAERRARALLAAVGSDLRSRRAGRPACRWPSGRWWRSPRPCATRRAC